MNTYRAFHIHASFVRRQPYKDEQRIRFDCVITTDADPFHPDFLGLVKTELAKTENVNPKRQRELPMTDPEWLPLVEPNWILVESFSLLASKSEVIL